MTPDITEIQLLQDARRGAWAEVVEAAGSINPEEDPLSYEFDRVRSMSNALDRYLNYSSRLNPYVTGWVLAGIANPPSEDQ